MLVWTRKIFPLLCIFLPLVGHTQQNVLASEGYLSDSLRARNLAELPPSIMLPDAWARALQKIAERTVQTGKETNVCLSFNPPNSAAEGTNLPLWHAGPSVDQNEHSGFQWYDRDTCGGSMASTAHTHPTKSVGFPSATDFESFSSARNMHSAIVQADKTICLTLKTTSAFRYRPNQAVGAWYSRINALDLEFADLSEDVRKQKMYSAVANAAELVGWGFYCGKPGEALERVPAQSFEGTLPAFYLLSKGILVADRYLRSNDEYEPAFSFPFTPEYDENFKRYLYLKLSLNNYSFISKNLSPLEVYYNVISELAKSSSKTFDSTYHGALSITKRETTGAAVAVVVCSSRNLTKKLVCNVGTINESADKTGLTREYASYTQNDGWYTLVDWRQGQFYKTEEGPKRRFKVICVYREYRCSGAGQGELEVKGQYVIEGTFNGVRLAGVGRIRLLPSNELWTVTQGSEGFIKGEPIR